MQTKWVADWNDPKQYKWNILFNSVTDGYICYCDSKYKNPGVNYMSEDVANKICEILNNKEVEL